MDRPPLGLAVGSLNPAKVAAVAAAAARLLPGVPVTGTVVQSGVSHQPLGLGPVRRGAVRRAWEAAGPRTWGIGLENGLVRRSGRLYVVGWCAVAAGRRVLGAASCPEYLVPSALAADVEATLAAGGTLAEATAHVAGGTAGAWGERGTVALVTFGAMERAELWRPAVVLALGVACWEAGLRDAMVPGAGGAGGSPDPSGV